MFEYIRLILLGRDLPLVGTKGTNPE